MCSHCRHGSDFRTPLALANAHWADPRSVITRPFIVLIRTQIPQPG
jgi:hypothetical protein